ncbi:erythrocyte membrane protein 1, PfEMP1, putative [Plasmodium reichenowi]|uniref:Erythrocyte membrane protein 1, PfEMP1, putative n=1 Tax=Plasmodium reichenowi TaxID=5854 RepID=A0A2P9D6M3_PLARE|nr:erythrocyte membrane protein 1, PfEMP1, putative [Plasmodium reichenowi]
MVKTIEEDEVFKRIEDTTAKHALDKIGGQIYEEAKRAAKQYTKKLEGNLLKAIFEEEPKERQTPKDPCLLKFRWHTNATKGKNYPCRNGTEERFSEVHGGECDNTIIKGNDETAGGACAPFRRVNLCVQNLENISNLKHITNDTLLADVCLAALHEGASIAADYPRYKETNNDVNTNLCTMLARSFADIGDIIRGKDLYRGDKGNDKLENKLKEIFAKIYNNVTSTNNSLRTRYEDGTGNFYKLREDWWTANRETVWKAIRCKAPKEADYFIQNACTARTGTLGRCRCISGEVPTNFDYVPQYLRWFEEWAEDFCRLRKRKLQNAKKICRANDEDGNQRYCDLNGFDCTQTARGRNQLVSDADCNKCSLPCDHFVHWIDNQKGEFSKQKQKYTKEMQKYTNGTNERSNEKINNLYVGEFYKKLKDSYGNVSHFLEKLNKGKICEKHPEVNNKDHIDFNENDDDIFSHTEYCQACPWCGVKNENGKWKPERRNCTSPKKKKEKKNTTNIPILTPNRRKAKILDKYSEFCKSTEDNSNVQITNWECYYEEKDEYEEDTDKNYCVISKDQHNTEEGNDRSYNSFFWKWVTEMLIDSMYWRKELNSCINNSSTKKCRSGCNTKCKCFEKWVKRKKAEWIKIKEYFEAQGGMKELGIEPHVILERILNLEELVKNIKEGYRDTKEIDDIKNMLKQEETEGADDGAKQDSIIDKLLNHEEQIATTCQETHKDDDCKNQRTRENVLRSEDPTPGEQPPEEEIEDHEDIPELQIDDEVLEEATAETETKEDQATDGVEDTEKTKEDTTQKVCDIVEKALTKDNLNAACSQKYSKPNRYWGWKCISDTTSKGETGESGNPRAKHSVAEPSGPKSDKDSGAICVPPRRRKLYIGKIKEWAKEQMGTTDKSQVEGSGQSGERSSESSEAGNSQERGTESTSGHTKAQQTQVSSNTMESGSSTTATTIETPEASLRRAFVESAAVETFFLWHQYKQLNTKDKGTQEDDLLGTGDYNGVTGPQGPYVGGGDSGGGIFSSLPPPTGAREPRLQFGEGLTGEDGTPGLPAGPKGPPGDSWAGERGTQSLSGHSTGREEQRTGELDGQLQLRTPQRSPQLPGTSVDSDPDSPHNQLLSGNIPPDFLRQMFYTLGDYRDIFIGGDRDIVGDTIISNTSNKDTDSGSGGDSSKKKTISDVITEFLQNSVNNKATRVTQPGSHSDKRTALWDEIAPSIWNGMICALTYTDNTDSETIPTDGKTTLKQDQNVYKQFFGDKNTLTNDNPSGKTGTFEGKYEYKIVTLSDKDSDTEALPSNAPAPGARDASPPSSTANGSTKLVDFITRPAYFRWLEEWGETFCVTRQRLLKDVRDNCMDDDDTQKYSGDGEDCNEIDQNKDEIFKNLEKPSCATPCRKYKTWIGKKKTEYEKQKKAYDKQKENCQKEGESDAKQFCGKLEENAAKFLNRLKTGPCSKTNNEDGEDKTVNGHINFGDDKTFHHTNLCDPCSKFTVKLEKCNCAGDSKANTCNGGRINAENIIDDKNGNGNIVMMVSDTGVTEFEGGLKDDCADADIFTGIKEHKWKCGNFCGYNVCGLINPDGNINHKHIILVRAFLKRWLEYFLEDYNKIKRKLKPCIKKDNGLTCISGCKEKCECVEKWAEQKLKEWEDIKKRYLDQYEKKDSDGYEVKHFLQQGPFYSLVEEAKKVVKCKDEQEKLWGCTGANLDGNEKNCKDDFITNLISKLKEKENKCETPTSGDTLSNCDNSTIPPNVGDVDDYEEENEVGKPNFCPTVDTPEQQENEGKCGDEDVEEKKEEEKEKVEENEEAADGEKGDQGESAPASPTKREGTEEKAPAPASEKKEEKKEKGPKPKLPPPPITSYSEFWQLLSASAFPWTVGVAFVALTYWFLKKKTKSSVDMLRVLQIPQNDYGMPTTKSSNKYIPYASGKYRSKRYIYLEGDSGTDSGYTDHYSDITSSSESEYEELDINDIYPYQSPKYKTLIEVVLEPSGKTQNDIQSDDIPSDDIPIDNTSNNKLTDIEWNELKQNFISNMLQSEPNDLPNNNISANTPMNTQPNTLYFDKPEEKHFIMSIHDRNLLSGEEYNYDMRNIVDSPYSGTKDPTSSNRDPISSKNDVYSGIDLINDALSGGNHDIYNEILKRKENELFGTNHTKNTSNNSVAKNTNSDPIHKQLELFHKWLDRHRNMCEKWENHDERLSNLKEKWHKDNYFGDIHSGENNINKMLNTDVSIQIHLDNPKPINQFSNMDTNVDTPTMGDMEDDIYYDVNDDDNQPSVDDIPMHHNKVDVPKKVHVEMKILNNTSNGSLEHEFPISDLWNI